MTIRVARSLIEDQARAERIGELTTLGEPVALSGNGASFSCTAAMIEAVMRGSAPQQYLARQRQ